MTWHFYDLGTGLFADGTLVCPDADVAANTPAGYGALRGEFDALSQRVDVAAEQPAEPELDEHGQPVLWAPPVIDYQPPAPADDELRTWAWDAATKRWVATPALLALQNAKWAEIKAAREAAMVAPTMGTPFGVFDADAESLDKIAKALQGRREAELLLGQEPAPIEWTLADNTAAALTTAELAQVAVLLLSRGDAAHQTARSLREAIFAATTPEEVQAVEWPPA